MKNQFFPDYAPKCPHKEAYERKCITGEDLMAIVKERDTYARTLICCGNCKHYKSAYTSLENGDDVYGCTNPKYTGEIDSVIMAPSSKCEFWEDEDNWESRV